MKRTIAILMAIAMILALCACGSSGSGTAPATPKPTAEPTPEPTPNPKEAFKAAKKAFEEEIGGSGLTYYESVRNDSTGKWRCAVIYTSANMVDHALSYYRTFFKSDDELHFICNLGLKTTTKISVVGDKLQVDVREYVDKEEHDAKIMNSGMLLNSYWVDMETGAAEKIQ